MNYFICGFSGAGKTTLLKTWQQDPCLSKYQFIDLDDYILASSPNYEALGELIRDKGFPFFREQERAALEELSLSDKQIVALGGGSLSEETLPILADWNGFWLNTDFETCYKRIASDQNRPMVEQSKDQLRAIYRERVKFYSRFPEVTSSECFL